MTSLRRALLAITIAAATAGAVSSPASAEVIDTSTLTRAVNAEAIGKHLDALQRIADANGGTRSVGTPGYAASGAYVTRKLKAAGFAVMRQPFVADVFTLLKMPRMARLAPSRQTYAFLDDFVPMQYSAGGAVTGELALARNIQIPPPADPGKVTSGCRPSDFPAAVAGRIVLVQRAACDFSVQVANGAAAGALAVVLFNGGQPGRTDTLIGTLGSEAAVPAVGMSFAAGRRLYDLARTDTVRLRVVVYAETRRVRTFNVIGEMKGTRKGRDVVVGAHLDSVPAGPGINDNGSGTATILTIAEEMSKLGIKPRNTLRVAFWGAEEEGLFGSAHYVDTLTAKQRAGIMANLNFDMLGSPNYVRFVYDGAGSIGPKGPPGSAAIQHVFERFFRSKGLASEPTPFDGRSDYQAFILAGIPAGGLFSGAEGVKTNKQARIFGGRAGKAYDSCYHQACDTIDNISKRALNELGKAAADATLNMVLRKDDIRPSAAPNPAEAAAVAAAMAYRGPRPVR